MVEAFTEMCRYIEISVSVTEQWRSLYMKSQVRCCSYLERGAKWSRHVCVQCAVWYRHVCVQCTVWYRHVCVQYTVGTDACVSSTLLVQTRVCPVHCWYRHVCVQCTVWHREVLRCACTFAALTSFCSVYSLTFSRISFYWAKFHFYTAYT
jgi:hypothetical protein